MADLEAQISPPRLRRGYAAMALLLCSCPLTASAQSHRRCASRLFGERQGASLRNMLTEACGDEQLSAYDTPSRLRGIRRLGHQGSDKAIAILLSAIEEPAVRDEALLLLAAVRALAPHSDDDAVITHLADIIDDSELPPGPLTRLARQTAALALASSDSHHAFAALLRSLRTPQRQFARAALMQSPPRTWRHLDSARFDDAGELARLLGDMGDMRVLGQLRKVARRKPHGSKKTSNNTALSPSISGANRFVAARQGHAKPIPESSGRGTVVNGMAAAVVALAKLGDHHALHYSQPWLRDDAPTPLRLAAIRARVQLHTAGADALLKQLLAQKNTRAEALALAEQSLSRGLLAALAPLLDEGPWAQRKRVVTLVGRIGGPEAAALLAPLMANSNVSTTAALALANIDHERAAQAIQHRLITAPAGAARRLALRAGLARRMRTSASPASTAAAASSHVEQQLTDTLQQLALGLLKSDAQADRAVAAATIGWLDEARAAALLRHHDEAVAVAAGGALLQRGVRGSALLAAFERAAAQHDDEAPLLLGLASVMLRADPGVTSARLVTWAKAGNALSPAAAFRLARRDSRRYRHDLRALFNSGDAVLRLHVAWGLQHSPQADATSLLSRRYLREPDPRVRRMLLRSLSWRSHAPRMQALRVAARQDPDAICRTLAQRALAGGKAAAPATVGPQVVWLSLRDNASSQGPNVALRPLLLVRENGTAAAVVAAPDGVVLAGGFPAARRMSLQLAPRAHKRDP